MNYDEETKAKILEDYTNGILVYGPKSKITKQKAKAQKPEKKFGKVGKIVASTALIATLLTGGIFLGKQMNKSNVSNDSAIVETVKGEFKVITSYDEAQALVAKAYDQGGWVSKLSDKETIQIQALAFQQAFYSETGKELTADEAMNFLIYQNIDQMSSHFLVNELGFNNKTAKNVAEDARNILTVYKIASDGGLDVKSLGYATANTVDAKYYTELNAVLKSGDKKALDEFALKFEADLLASKHSMATKVAGTMALYNIAGVKGLSGYADVAVTGKSANCENTEMTMSIFSENNAKLDQQLEAKLIQGATESTLGLNMIQANDNIAQIFFLKNPTANNAMEAKKEAVRAENDAINFKIPAGQEVKPSDNITKKPSNGKPGEIDSGKKDYIAPETKKEQQEGTNKTVTDNKGNTSTGKEAEQKEKELSGEDKSKPQDFDGDGLLEYWDGSKWVEENPKAGQGVQQQSTVVTPVPQSAPVQQPATPAPKTEEPKVETPKTEAPKSNVQESTKYTATDGTTFNSESELIDYVISGGSKTK